MSATGKADERGFTLLEMLVVLAVTALVGGIAFPALERSLDAHRFGLAAREVEGALRQARTGAVAGGARVAFVAPMVAAPLTLELPSAGIAFFPDGTASGGTVTLNGPRREVRFEIARDTGLVRVER